MERAVERQKQHRAEMKTRRGRLRAKALTTLMKAFPGRCLAMTRALLSNTFFGGGGGGGGGGWGGGNDFCLNCRASEFNNVSLSRFKLN